MRSDASTPGPGAERTPHRVRFWIWAVLGVGMLANAGRHVVVRDGLWGLALGWYGGLAVVFLALGRRSWRVLRARGRLGELDFRRWFRDSTDRAVRGWFGGAMVAVAAGGLLIAVVLPALGRSGLGAVPWTVGWALVAGLAWAERRRRVGGTPGGRAGAD